VKKKNIKNTSKYDSERETRVLLEEICTEVKSVAEQVTSNSTKLQKLDKIDKIDAELSTVKMAVMENSKGIKSNSEGIKANSEGIKENRELIKSNSEGIKEKREGINAKSEDI